MSHVPPQLDPYEMPPSNRAYGSPVGRPVWLPVVGMLGAMLLLALVTLGALAYACYMIFVWQQASAAAARDASDQKFQAEYRENMRRRFEPNELAMRRGLAVPGMGAALILVESDNEIDLHRVINWANEFTFADAAPDPRYATFGKSLLAAAARQNGALQSELQQAASNWERKREEWGAAKASSTVREPGPIVEVPKFPGSSPAERSVEQIIKDAEARTKKSREQIGRTLQEMRKREEEGRERLDKIRNDSRRRQGIVPPPR